MRQIEDILSTLRTLHAKPCHEQRVLRAWLQGLPLDAGANRQRAADHLPLVLRQALPGLGERLAALVRLRAEHPAGDGAARLLLELGDGQTIESVLLPRDGLCVSTQVGCAVGCVFCMTGRDGLKRQLGSAEIIAQVVQARRQRRVKKVVFMGMGEPAHNLERVLTAIDLLGTAGGIGHKNLVFSTVGERRVFERLPQQRVKPALAISLHSIDAVQRRRLLPRAPHIAPLELLDLGEQYARSSGYPIQYQWTLLAGINDSLADIERLAGALQGKYAMMNFIPFNRVEGSDFERPSMEHAQALTRCLRRRGIIACLRDSAGQEIEGGCGQLRARVLESSG